MSELVSVVVPTFKRPDRLLRTIKGILNQTHQDFEVWIVDDEQDENDLSSLVNEFGDSRLNLVKNKRGKGANGARNTGSVMAKGRFIAFHDDDDEWLPSYLQKKLEAFEELGADYGLVYSAYYIEEKEDKWLEKKQYSSGNILGDLITDRFRIGSSSNIFIRKEVLDAVGLWDEELKRQQDLEFLVRTCSRFKAARIEDFLLKVYGHNDPSPDKSFETREIYAEKISGFLDQLSEEDRNAFFSNHYRRQANYLVKMKAYGKALEYWKRASRSKRFVIRKDAKIIVSLLTN